MATYLGTTTCVRGQVTSLRINGWLVGCCGAAFWVQVGKVWVREEVRWVHDNGSCIFKTKEPKT